MQTIRTLALATAMTAMMTGMATAADTDATKLYDPMAEAEKVVIAVD